MAEKFNQGEIELIPKINTSEMEKGTTELSKEVLHSVGAVEEALQQKLKNISNVYDDMMDEIVSSCEQAYKEAENKLAKSATRIQQQTEKKFKTELAQRTGIIPKGKNGDYTPKQLKDLQLSNQDSSNLVTAKATALSNSATINKRQKELETIKSNVESLKELKKITMSFNSDALEKIPKILTDIGVSGEKLTETIKNLKEIGEAVVKYEKIAQNEIGRIESSKSKSSNIRTDRGIDQSKTNKSSSSTRIKSLMESLDKTTAETVNTKVEQMVSTLKASSKQKAISQAKIDEITEVVLEETLRNLKAQGSKIVPTGRKKAVVEYDEGTPVEKGKGVLTARNFDSFVINGQFIPSSRYVEDEKGVASREFFKSIGILDSRLANPKNIGGLGNLYNASITQLQQAYDTLTSILDSTNLNQETRKQIEGFRDVLVSAVADSFGNTNEEELKQRLSRSIYGTDAYNRNVYEQMYEDATFNKQGAFYEALRKQIPNLTATTEYDEFDYDSLAYEHKESDSGRDNATTVEQLMEETVKNAIAVAERVKALKELTDYFKNNGLDSLMQGLSSDLQNTSDSDVRANAIKIAQELIMQALDDMGYEISYNNNNGLDFTDQKRFIPKSHYEETGEEDEDFIMSQIASQDDTEEEAILKTVKAQYYGLLEQYKSYIQNVITKSIPDSKKEKMLGEIDDLIKMFPEDYNDSEGNEILDIITELSEIETRGAEIPKNLDKLKSVIDEISLDRKHEEEEAEDISKDALSLEEGRKKVKSGESFKEDKLYDETDDLYGAGWVKRVKEALSRSEGELDDSAKQLINNFVNAVYDNVAKLDSEETRTFAKQLQSAFRSSDDSVSLYNILSKMLEEANTVDASIKRYVKELNEQAGADLFDFDTELENWKTANPDRVKAYERSKKAREAFDNAGGLVDIKKSMDAVFNVDDFYIQQLKKRFDALNYDIEDTIEYALQDDEGNYLTDEKGELIKKTKQVTQNVQETILKGIVGRLDASGTFENPNKYTGSSYYKGIGQKGEELPENAVLSPQQKTSLYYQAGYTGAVYGGRTIGENITNAEKILVAKQEELAKKKSSLTDTQIKMLEAQISVIENDLQKLRKASARKASDSDLANTTLELIQTPDSSQMITVTEGKDDTKKRTESVSQAYERAKRLKEAQESKKLIPGYSYKLNNGTTGEILEDLGNDSYKVSMIKDSVTSGMKTKKETTVIGKKFIENLYDYIAPAAQKLSDNVGEQIQEEAQNKKKVDIKSPENQIVTGNTGTTNISSGTVYVDSELTNVNTADVALVSKGNANVNLTGKVNLNGDISVEGNGSNENQSSDYGKVNSIKGFKPDFIDKDGQHKYVNPETGKSFLSVTQLRDYLIRGQNPTFGVDIERIKEKAKANFEAGLDAISIDDFEGIQPNDFKFMIEDVIGQGIRGDTFHSLIDKFVKSGLPTEDWTLEKLAEKDNKAFNDYQKEYKLAVEELAKYGIGEEFLGISERLESYVDAMKKSGMAPTKFSEQRLAFTMSGTRGDISVGVTPDQLFSMGNTGAFVDNKTGSVHGQEAFQLTGQMLATLANLDAELTDSSGKSLGKVKDFLAGIDFNKPMKGYIADVEDGVTQLKEYVLMSRDEFYNLAMDAQEIAEGKKAPLSKEERNRRMNRQLKTGTTIGYSDAKYAESVNEELMFIDADQGKVIREYLSQLAKVKKTQLEIQSIEKKIEAAREKGGESAEQEVNSLTKQLKAQKDLLATYGKGFDLIGRKRTITSEDGTKHTLIGNNILDEEHVAALNQKTNELIKNYENKSIKAIENIQTRLNKLGDIQAYIDNGLNTGLFGEDFETILQKVKNGYSEIDRTQESLNARVVAYKNSLNDEVKALGEMATHSTKIKSINEQIDKLQSDNSTENSEIINDLNKRLKKEQELLKIAEQRRDVAIQERQGTGLDKDIASGKIGTDVKLTLANAYSQQRQNLVNAVNQGTAKAEADQSVQNYVQANKLIKEYINNLKLQYKTQQEIQKLSIKMENQSGNELAASEAYKAALESRIDSLQEQLPYYDQQSKKLGNIKLEEEQIISLEKQKNNLAKQQQIAQEKINATVKNQRNILEEIVGGFKQAFRNMTDASIAYEIIGMFRQGVTELLQTIREMDSALVDLQIASGGTREEMHDMMMDLNGLATEVGKTTTEVAQGANDWLRAGYEGLEAADLTRASMQLSTLGMIDSADATSYLISVLKGWKLEAEDVSNVVDKLVAVDMAAALNF